MVFHRSQEGQTEPLSALVPTLRLQCYKGKHQAVDGCTCQGIAHGDVHVGRSSLFLFFFLFFLFAFFCICLVIRYAMQDGLKLLFIAQHQCRLSLLQGEVLPQPLRYVSCGTAVRTGGDEGYLPLVAQVVVDARACQSIGEAEQVFAYEVASLKGTVLHVHHVEVPIEQRPATVVQIRHQFLLRFAQHVEAHEAIHRIVVQQVKHFLVLHRLALQCTLVGLCALGHCVLQLVVQLWHYAPEFREALLQASPVLSLETAEELLQGLALVVCQEVQALHVAQFLGIEEKRIGIHQMLVYVVEVGKHYLAPSPEHVQRLRLVAHQHLIYII